MASGVELRQLRYFLVVARELHFGRAAQRLHITQPPLSAQIRQLEAELGFPLLVRTTRHVELTAAGRELRDRLTEVLAELDRALDGLREVAAGRQGRLSIGFTSSAGNVLVPRAVRRFREIAPGVELSLLPLTTGEQIDLLHEGGLDVAIVRDTEATAGIDVTPLLTEELVAYLPAQGPSTVARGPVTPGELSELGMISFPFRLMPGYVGRVLEIFRGLDAPPRIAHRTVHQETALGFVAAGLGFAILPESSGWLSPEGVVMRRISTRPKSVTSFARPIAHAPSAAVEIFVGCLRHVVAARG